MMHPCNSSQAVKSAHFRAGLRIPIDEHASRSALLSECRWLLISRLVMRRLLIPPILRGASPPHLPYGPQYSFLGLEGSKGSRVATRSCHRASEPDTRRKELAEAFFCSFKFR